MTPICADIGIGVAGTIARAVASRPAAPFSETVFENLNVASMVHVDNVESKVGEIAAVS